MDLVGGFNPSEKYYIVSWDDYSQHMGKKSHVPNHQPVDSLFSAPSDRLYMAGTW